MKDDIPQAAFNLMTALPKRVHYAPEPMSKHFEQKARRIAGTARPRGQQNRPIEVDGVRYPSRTIAKRELKIGSMTLTRWLDSGVARHVD